MVLYEPVSLCNLNKQNIMKPNCILLLGKYFILNKYQKTVPNFDEC
jgi:hypothetical protein